MKKIIIVLMCLILVVLTTACGRETSDDGIFEIACTSHVVADWVSELTVGCENVSIVLLADSGKDMHNFQPAAADIKAVYGSDLLIYIGGESDTWVEDMRKNAGFPESLKLLELVEGAHCDDGCLEEGDHHHADRPDEHIWLSIENPAVCALEIAELLSDLAPDNADKVRENYEKYSAELEELKSEYVAVAERATHKAVVFADRFPFIYLIEELGLKYYAAFPGCSSETSASFETVVTLASAVDENDLPCVLTLEDSVDGIAERVVEYVESEKVAILALDSMQIYKADVDFDYVTAMRDNLDTLKLALGYND